LNTARLFGTTVCRRISQSRSRQSRDELSASFIPLQHLCPIGRHFTIMLDFHLFPIHVTNYVEISFRKYVIRPVAFTICSHQPVTSTSPVTSRLRRASIGLCPIPRKFVVKSRNRTNCYKSFIHHAVLKIISNRHIPLLGLFRKHFTYHLLTF